MVTIFIIDDDPYIRELISTLLPIKDFVVYDVKGEISQKTKETIK